MHHEVQKRRDAHFWNEIEEKFHDWYVDMEKYKTVERSECVALFASTLVALVFRHLRYFGPSGGIGPVSTYQLTKKLKFWLTKGNVPIKLLVYTIFYYTSLIQLGMYVYQF